VAGALVDVGGGVGVGDAAVDVVGGVWVVAAGVELEQPLSAINGTTNQAIWRSFMGVLSASVNVMVNLTRIYTSTGDDGQTRLADNSVVRKTDPRIALMGAIDEANCAIGVALTLNPSTEIQQVLQAAQNELFDVGADIATPASTATDGTARDSAVIQLETYCDRFNAGAPPLRSFVLPGGCPLAAQLHVARAVVRRAELTGWSAKEKRADIDPSALRYLNRLSDLLFILARHANACEGSAETLWTPGS